MRLSKNQVAIIKSIIFKSTNSNSQIYLFGSRLDDKKRGGDIDLLIKTNEPIALKTLLKTKIALEDTLSLPVDVINYIKARHQSQATSFQKLAYAQAVQI